MATTNHNLAAMLQVMHPHTFNALQNLVMAMADYQKNRHKTPFFGRDRALIAYRKFQSKLHETLVAMQLDGMIRADAMPGDYRERLMNSIERFAEAFPNWMDAYAFAYEYLTQSEKAEAEIARMLRSD